MKTIECPKCNHRFTLQQIKRRQCSKCKRWKSVKEFYFNKQGNAWCPYCRKCRGYKGVYHSTLERKDGRKQCRRCKRWKDELEFGKNPKTRDGFKVYCRTCTRKYNTSYSRERRRLKKLSK